MSSPSSPTFTAYSSASSTDSPHEPSPIQNEYLYPMVYASADQLVYPDDARDVLAYPTSNWQDKHYSLQLRQRSAMAYACDSDQVKFAMYHQDAANALYLQQQQQQQQHDQWQNNYSHCHQQQQMPYAQQQIHYAQQQQPHVKQEDMLLYPLQDLQQHPEQHLLQHRVQQHQQVAHQHHTEHSQVFETVDPFVHHRQVHQQAEQQSFPTQHTLPSTCYESMPTCTHVPQPIDVAQPGFYVHTADIISAESPVSPHGSHLSSAQQQPLACDPRFVSGSPREPAYRSTGSPASISSAPAFAHTRYHSRHYQYQLSDPELRDECASAEDDDRDAEGELDDDSVFAAAVASPSSAPGTDPFDYDLDAGESDNKDDADYVLPPRRLAVPNGRILRRRAVASSSSSSVSSDGRFAPYSSSRNAASSMDVSALEDMYLPAAPDGTPLPLRRRPRPPTILPIPVPVPNLTKKSRGRRVPTAASLTLELQPRQLVAALAGGSRRGSKGLRLYTCKVPGCGKCFVRGEHLKRHVRSIHTHEKPHRCPYPGCGKDFSRHDNLCQHMRVHKDYVLPKGTSLTSLRA